VNEATEHELPCLHKAVNRWSEIMVNQLLNEKNIALTLLGLLLITCKSPKKEETWTEAQKEQVKRDMINSSAYLKSISSDTADIIATCSVEKIAKKFTPQEMIELTSNFKSNKDSVANILQPLIQDCMKPFLGEKGSRFP
jgi:hypothetical protein